MATDGASNRINGTLATGNGTFQPTDTVYLLRREHPQVQLTWASKFPSKVDKLKLRKEISVFPIKLTLKADYDTNSREFDYGCSARVRCFEGLGVKLVSSFIFNLPRRRRRCSLKI